MEHKNQSHKFNKQYFQKAMKRAESKNTLKHRNNPMKAFDAARACLYKHKGY